MDARATPCPLCETEQIAAFSAVPSDIPGGTERVSLKECLGCGLAWQYPRLRSFSQSVERHAAKYTEQQPHSYFDPAHRKAIAATELAFLGECLGSPTTLLDVGAGDGTFVSIAGEHGWSCIGVDPAATDKRAAYASGGSFECVRGTLGDLASGRRFAVITLWDVIEHLEDPEPLISGTVDRLEDQGVLVVESGNYESVDRIESRDRWWGYAADHRWYFSPRNLRRLLTRAGYRHIYCASRVLRPAWKGKSSYDGPSRSRTLKAILRSPLSALSEIRTYRALAVAKQTYASLAGLGIFTIVAGLQPVAAAGRQSLIEI